MVCLERHVSQSAGMVDRLVSGTSVHYGRKGSTPFSGTASEDYEVVLPKMVKLFYNVRLVLCFIKHCICSLQPMCPGGGMVDTYA